jgi:hypothetical protein
MGLKSRAEPKSARIQPGRQKNSVGAEAPKPFKIYGVIDIDAGLLADPRALPQLIRERLGGTRGDSYAGL